MKKVFLFLEMPRNDNLVEPFARKSVKGNTLPCSRVVIV